MTQEFESNEKPANAHLVGHRIFLTRRGAQPSQGVALRRTSYTPCPLPVGDEARHMHPLLEIISTTMQRCITLLPENDARA